MMEWVGWKLRSDLSDSSASMIQRLEFPFRTLPGTLAVFQLNGSNIIEKELAGTRVLFDGEPAPIIAASSGQVNAIVPYSVAGRDATTVKVEYQGATTAEFTVPVAEASPAIFTLDRSGSGPGAILNQDYTINGPNNRAAKGSIVQIFATGEGQTAPAGIDGKIAAMRLEDLPAPLLPVTVTIGGLDAPVHYAGAAPGLVAGVIQINAEVPRDAASGGAVPIVIRIGDRTSPAGVTLAVQ